MLKPEEITVLYDLTLRIGEEKEVLQGIDSMVKNLVELLDCSAGGLIIDGFDVEDELGVAQIIYPDEFIVKSNEVLRDLKNIYFEDFRIESNDFQRARKIVKESSHLYILSVRQVGFIFLEKGRGDLSELFLNSLVNVLNKFSDYILFQIQSKQLTLARDLAEKANESKSQFLAVMSHEIRTPLNGVIGMSQLLKETSLSSEQKHLVDQISFSSRTLHNIITDILDFSKLEYSEIELESRPFNIVKLCENLIETLELEDKKKTDKNVFQLDYEDFCTPVLIGDETRVAQIIINLLSNANKFTSKGLILIRLSRDGEYTKIEVKDNGIGIPENKIKEIFNPFSQADISTTRKFGGTGLGLPICEKIASEMNGKLIVESRLGKGTTFCAYLKINAKGTAIFNKDDFDTNYIKIIKDSKRKLNIAIAEDNIINQKLIEKIVARVSSNVQVFQNGRELIKDLEQNSYDLIFLDLRMPVMDGYQAIRIIRKSNKEVPVIAVTANSTLEEKSRCMKEEFTDFVSKPYQFKDIYKMIYLYLIS